MWRATSLAVRGTGKFLLHTAVFPTWRAEKCWTDESSADSDLQVNEKAACTDTAALARATKTAFACRLPQTPYRRYGARARDKGRMPVRRLRAEPNPVGSRGAPDRATAGPLPLGAQVKMALAEVWPKLPEKASLRARPRRVDAEAPNSKAAPRPAKARPGTRWRRFWRDPRALVPHNELLKKVGWTLEAQAAAAIASKPRLTPALARWSVRQGYGPTQKRLCARTLRRRPQQCGRAPAGVGPGG